MLQPAPPPGDNEPTVDPYTDHGDGIIDQDAPIQHRRVLLIYRILMACLIPQRLAEWFTEGRSDYQGGRDRDLSDVAILVVMLILAIEHAPLHFRAGAKILHHRLLPESRALLGLADDASEKQWYDRLQNGFSRLIALMDPRPGKRHRKLTTAEAQARKDAREADPATEEKMQDRLDWFCNELLRATIIVKPDLLDGWGGNITIDATAFRVFSKGSKKKAPYADIELDAAWYMRTHSHKDTDDPTKARVVFYGYEIHVVVPASNTGDSTEDTFVKPAIGISCCKPSERPAWFGLCAIRRAYAGFKDHMVGGIIVADRGYFANAEMDQLQMPVRELGMGFITDYKYDQLGPIGEVGGAIQIEGDLFCPGTPPNLQWATKQVRSKDEKLFPRIDQSTWLKRRDSRYKYLLPRKEKPDARGTVPLRCPAIGPSAKILCLLRPEDWARNKDKEGMTKILRSHMPKKHLADRICTNSSVHVKRTDSGKYRQDIPFASPQWFRLYRSGRNFIEGINAYVKDGTKTALGNPAKRRARGYAKQYVFASTLLFASNLRLIESHLRKQTLPTILPATNKPRRRDVTNGFEYDPATGVGKKPNGITNGYAGANGYPTEEFIEDMDALD
ncbi:hypothetical protein [Curtobacterium flaccumfaciens]|uniref:hypothetical protein n=1 Tax=Curtobacterium flaccumfaciens TaxID=2035 RepID=UPI00220DD5EB|nr:hypothetical protein [Curtobacterium flaccumfaciens]UWD79218.1 hypothetical protein NY058_00120 [Curtobacterium flaccumfaciens]